MTTLQSAVTMAASRSGHATTAKRFPLLDKYFYLGMSLLVAVTVVYGFSHTVNQDLIHATPVRPWILWVHGIVFSAWVAFFIFQSALVRTRNVKLHRTMGWFGAGLAALMTVLGISTAIVMDRFFILHFNSPQVAVRFRGFFAIQLLDIASFTVAFWLAVLWRRKPEFHRRLILIATCILTAAAFGRFPWLPHHSFYAGVDLLIFLGVVRDLIVIGRVHVVYRYALPLVIASQVLMLNAWLHQWSWWMRIAHVVIG